MEEELIHSRILDSKKIFYKKMTNNEMKVSQSDSGIRLERFFKKVFPQIPRAVRQKFFRKKKLAVFRNKKRQKLDTSFLLEHGDIVKIFFNLSEFGEEKFSLENRNIESTLKNKKLQNIRIAYEDEFFWIAEKPAGLSVHPGSDVKRGFSFIDYFIALSKKKEKNSPEPKLVHRIDKNTSGLVIISKRDDVLRKLVRILTEGNIQKKYLALVQGEMEKKETIIGDKIIRTEGRMFHKIQVDNEKGKSSFTHYKTKRFYPSLNASLLEILLKTGRMHQIRVHFSFHNHPLAGDTAYGDFKWNKFLQKKFKLKRQFLHASSLSFFHPITKKKLLVKSNLPDDLLKILKYSKVCT